MPENIWFVAGYLYLPLN